MSRRYLPSFDERSIARRPFLLGTASAAVLTACGTVMQESEGGDVLAIDTSRAESGTDAGLDSARADSAIDAGSFDGALDAGRDATVRDAAIDTSADTATGADAARDAGADVVTCSPGPVRLGTVTTFARGTWHLVSAARVIVGHDSGGLYAYSDVCTHSGCIVNAPSSTGVSYCPCHGSRFDGNGAVVNGPATSPLSHYKVTICAGIAYVDRTMRVAASVRTPVP